MLCGRGLQHSICGLPNPFSCKWNKICLNQQKQSLTFLCTRKWESNPRPFNLPGTLWCCTLYWYTVFHCCIPLYKKKENKKLFMPTADVIQFVLQIGLMRIVSCSVFVPPHHSLLVDWLHNHKILKYLITQSIENDILIPSSWSLCRLYWQPCFYLEQYACLLFVSLLTIIADVDLYCRHESELPVCQARELNPGHPCRRWGW